MRGSIAGGNGVLRKQPDFEFNPQDPIGSILRGIGNKVDDKKAKFEIKVATVARRMLANKKLKLDIFAYLTKAELTKTNVKLATDRLQAIYFILVNRYRIDPNRIKYDILEPSESDEGSDIRCDMVYR